MLNSERDLAGVCAALIGAAAMERLTCTERRLVETDTEASLSELDAIRLSILAGDDPLGMAFARIRTPDARRSLGAVYTPQAIVDSMLAWVESQCEPARIVDPGAGSGRYLMAAARMFPKARLVAIELDPLAALMLRANLAVAGHAHRATVLVQDYRDVQLTPCDGVTAFVGNPPYVRHHDIDEERKRWYVEQFARQGVRASGLAGLHLHFFLQTCLLARDGDIGAFVTSAEWMSVNYGSALRHLLLGELGGVAVHVLSPRVEAFPGTASTAAITCFRVGETESPLRVKAVDTLEGLGGLDGLEEGHAIHRSVLGRQERWSTGPTDSDRPAGSIELGELFRVHRGQVTGANGIWIAGPQAARLPRRTLVPAVTKARDLISAGEVLNSLDTLRRIVDLPEDLDEFTQAERHEIEAFLRWARDSGADQGYIARHRRAWWSVGLRKPAPILCTYMARRPPQFTLNNAGARHINIAHGLYPRQELAVDEMVALVAWLNNNTVADSGRTYAGGLTKFEPREIERLRIPIPRTLTS